MLSRSPGVRCFLTFYPRYLPFGWEVNWILPSSFTVKYRSRFFGTLNTPLSLILGGGELNPILVTVIPASGRRTYACTCGQRKSGRNVYVKPLTPSLSALQQCQHCTPRPLHNRRVVRHSVLVVRPNLFFRWEKEKKFTELNPRSIYNHFHNKFVWRECPGRGL